MTMASETSDTSASSSRSRRPRRSESTGNASRRPRGPRATGEALLADLTQMVDRLILENRELKRALARVQKTDAGASLGQAARALSGLQRRVSRALTSTVTTRRRGAAAAVTPAPKPRRKVTDPEVLERRRQALAKARAARQAKREAARQ
jgi:hypothetical protein